MVPALSCRIRAVRPGRPIFGMFAIFLWGLPVLIGSPGRAGAGERSRSVCSQPRSTVWEDIAAQAQSDNWRPAPVALAQARENPVIRENLDSAQANLACYDVFDSFKKLKDGADPVAFKNCFQAGKGGADGLYAISPRPECQAGALHAPPGYQASHVACVNSAHETTSLDCDFFVTIFSPRDPASGLSPIVSFKGTTEVAEWKANILNRGASLIKDTMQSLLRPAGAAKVNNPLAEDLYRYSQGYPNRRLVFTGHSLGGAMAQTLSAGYTHYLLMNDLHGDQRQLPPIQVVTFNSLAGSSLASSLTSAMPDLKLDQIFKTLQKVNPLPGTAVASASQENSQISARNFVTVDDPLQIYNRGAHATNLSGGALRLPSRSTIDSHQQYTSRGIEGHYMENVLDDLRYTYSLAPDDLHRELARRLKSPAGEFNQFEEDYLREHRNDPGFGDDARGGPLDDGTVKRWHVKQVMDEQRQDGLSLLRQELSQLDNPHERAAFYGPEGR